MYTISAIGSCHAIIEPYAHPCKPLRHSHMPSMPARPSRRSTNGTNEYVHLPSPVELSTNSHMHPTNSPTISTISNSPIAISSCHVMVHPLAHPYQACHPCHHGHQSSSHMTSANTSTSHHQRSSRPTVTGGQPPIDTCRSKNNNTHASTPSRSNMFNCRCPGSLNIPI